MDIEINDYLTKQVSIDRNVVTFRSLSRKFDIHVNAAKTALAAFHNASEGSPEAVSATYMLTGEALHTPKRRSQVADDSMQVDTEGDSGFDEESDGEIIPLTKVTLVGEHDLESAKSQYLRIFSVHIYSLSPAPLVDAGLVCGPSEKIYEADAKMPVGSSILLGRIVGSHVQKGKPIAPAASTSKAKATVIEKEASSKQTVSKTTDKVKEEPKAITKEDRPRLKSKPSGTLDWSKARPKPKDEQNSVPKKEKSKVKEEEKQKEEVSERKRKSPPVPQTTESSRAGTPVKAELKPEVKRGVKRKSTLPTTSDSEDESQEKDIKPTRKKSPTMRKEFTIKAETKQPSRGRKPALRFTPESENEESMPPAPRLVKSNNKSKKGVVLSDDDSDDGFEPANHVSRGFESFKGKARTRSTLSESEKSLRAMMDIDDSEVTKASRLSPETDQDAVETQVEDTEVVDDSEPERIKAKPRKRKEKKVVPVGRNGLKKKRVIKSGMRLDEKGYMVTEDHSSYESVDEEEAEETPPTKAKGKKGSSAKSKKTSEAAETKLKVKSAPKEERAASKSSDDSHTISRKPSGTSKAGGRGNLMNFFGKK